MKAYLFIETGEVRPPKEGEHFWNIVNNIEQSEGTKIGDRAILTRHEIEIPEGATDIYVGIERKGLPAYQRDIFRTSIPRPKVKVKKWYWIVEDRGPRIGYCNANVCPRTEAEIKAAFPYAKWYHRIDETMVEVEE